MFVWKQKKAYEMRISYGSADVCSADLGAGSPFVNKKHPGPGKGIHKTIGSFEVFSEPANDRGSPSRLAKTLSHFPDQCSCPFGTVFLLVGDHRSEERRVGKELSVRVELGGGRIIKKKK